MIPAEWTTSGPANVTMQPNHSIGPFFDANAMQILESVKDLPSQILWLQNSLQQRESDIANLNNELHACKTELSALRGNTTRVHVLENEIRCLKEMVESIQRIMSPGKGKLTR